MNLYNFNLRLVCIVIALWAAPKSAECREKAKSIIPRSKIFLETLNFGIRRVGYPVNAASVVVPRPVLNVNGKRWSRNSLKFQLQPRNPPPNYDLYYPIHPELYHSYGNSHIHNGNFDHHDRARQRGSPILELGIKEIQNKSVENHFRSSEQNNSNIHEKMAEVGPEISETDQSEIINRELSYFELSSYYKKMLSELGTPSEVVPDFTPFPGSQEDTDDNENYLHQIQSGNKTEAEALDDEAGELNTLESALVRTGSPKQVRQFFKVLSMVDNGTCFERLFCDIHAKVGQPWKKFTRYEKNVILLFKLMESEIDISDKRKTAGEDPTALKYLKAAEFGKQNISATAARRWCLQMYPVCPFSMTTLARWETMMKTSE